MNFWKPNFVQSQDFIITPRVGLISSTLGALTADTTLYTADTTQITADIVNTANGDIVIQYIKDGFKPLYNVNAIGVLEGSKFIITAILDIEPEMFYYFKVYFNGNEIFKGKAFGINEPVLPLHYSMYEGSNIN